MPDNNKLTTTCKGGGVALTGNVNVNAVAKRMLDRMPADVPMRAVETVAMADHDIQTAAQSVRLSMAPSVSRFAQVYGKRALAAVVLSHLTIVEDLANVSRPLKPEAMAMIAKTVAMMLLDDDVSINLSDLQIVADRLVKGEAGDIYGGLNSQIVVKAFTDYMAEKATEFAAWRAERSAERYGGGFGSERTSGTTDAAKAIERVKHAAAREAYRNGELGMKN